jgi:polar amino acid transport system substrate-binding protein
MKAFKYLLFAALSVHIPGTAAETLNLGGQDYPPFNWLENNAPKGAMVDVVNALCTRLKIECRITIVPLARGLNLLENGTLDGFISLSPNAQRMAYSSTMNPIIVSKISYLTLDNEAQAISNEQALNHWQVTAVRGSTTLALLYEQQKKINDLLVTEEINSDTMIKKLKNHHTERPQSAVFGSEEVLNHIAAENDIHLTPIYTVTTQNFTNIFSKKTVPTSMIDSMNATLEDMKKTGELQKILDPWGMHIAP